MSVTLLLLTGIDNRLTVLKYGMYLNIINFYLYRIYGDFNGICVTVFDLYLHIGGKRRIYNVIHSICKVYKWLLC